MAEKPSLLLRIVPTWRGNLIFFGLLIVIALAYFYHQVKYAQETFLNHAIEHTQVLGAVIQVNARGVVQAQEASEKIISTFLFNAARFVDYLDSIDPFSNNELTAFVVESGISGVKIYGDKGRTAEGPAGWLEGYSVDHGFSGSEFVFWGKNHLYLLKFTRDSYRGTIIIGLRSEEIEKLQDRTSLSSHLQALSGLAGIHYVSIQKQNKNDPQSLPDVPGVRLIRKNGVNVAETRLPLGEDILVVGMNSDRLFSRITRLWNQFFSFSIIIAFTGAFFSWLLYRYQNAHVTHVRNIERHLAKEQEDAAVGRATMAITHEIRNPLNAVHMGLQRLQMESDNLSGEQQDLITSILQSVKRTDVIIKELKRFAGPVNLRKTPVKPATIIRNLLKLYQQKCDTQSINVTFNPQFTDTVMLDEELIGACIENLIKNSIEAQPTGGFLTICLYEAGLEIVLSFENGGMRLSGTEIQQLMQPYVTTKPMGSGLGLTIVHKIIDAHGGRMSIESPDSGGIKITVFLSDTPDTAGA